MATITTRSGKGSPLTNTELDANFTNLNNDKQEVLAEGSFADGDKTKLDGIESGATADQTAQEIATAIDADATAEATLKSALGLGTAAYTASTDYATAAQGALADSALQSIPDNYVLNTGDAITGNLSFGDNDKAIFGGGSDLQIYHDGTDTYISESGVGSLIIEGETLTLKRSSVSTKKFIEATANAQVDLYHNGAIKLATTSTGIDVTGTVTADGLTVDNSGSNNFLRLNNSTTGRFATYNLDDNQDLIIWNGDSLASGSNGIRLKTGSGSGISRALFSANGDISFYEDTGTTAKFFWDASAESLGIGTTSPQAPLHVKTAASTNVAMFDYVGVPTVCGITDAGSSAELRLAGATLSFSGAGGAGSEHMRIDSSGRVGIGTSSPARKLHVYDASSQYIQISGNSRDLLLGQDGTGCAIYSNGAVPMYFSTNGSERMRIDSSGNVGIGTSTATEKLHVNGNVKVSSAGSLYVHYDASDSYRSSLDWNVLQFGNNGANRIIAGRSNPNGYLQFWVNNTADVENGGTPNGTKAMTIDSSGNVGIGTTSPAYPLHVYNPSNSVAGTIETGLQWSTLGFKSTGSVSNYHVRVGADNQDFVAYTNNTERMRINSSGDVRIGTTGDTSSKLRVYTDSASKSAIHAQHAVGSASGGATNSALWVEAPKNTISMFVGKTESTAAYGSSDYSGTIRFNGSNIAWGDLSYYPTGHSAGGQFRFTANGSSVSATPNASIGVSGVYFGGTGSANHMDDYEEGTFTPTLSGVTSGAPSYNYQEGYYVKTGAWVHCTGIIGVSNSSSMTGTIGVNVPFTAKTTTFGQSVGGAADGQGFTFPIANSYSVRFTIGNNAVARLVSVASGGSAYSYNSTGVGNNWYFRFNFSYYTNT